MQIIIILPNKATHKHLILTIRQILLASIVMLMFFSCLVFYVSQRLATPLANEYSAQQSEPQFDLKQTIAISEQEVPAFYAKRLGDLQAEAIRLKAIIEQLANLTGVNLSHYALDTAPGQGGVQDIGTLLTSASFGLKLSQLSDTFATQLQQLELMQTYAVTEDVITSSTPSRNPIDEGWLSSSYGNRIDPFNGKATFHYGLDFAGKEGSHIFAVADGLVSWVGRHSGYGKMVDIDHGNGYITRYAHNKSLLVSLGDKVTRGQKIALMGSTGRSTGPHVHFELLREGRKINPYSVVKN